MLSTLPVVRFLFPSCDKTHHRSNLKLGFVNIEENRRMAKAKKNPSKVAQDLLGSVEELTLAVVLKLGDDANGLSVYEEIRSIYPPISFGSVYTALERMTWKGYLETRLGDPEPRRGGRARRYFRITKSGQTILRATVTVHERVRALVPNPA
jgi:PadR family transcriptional regulator PadR